MWTRGFLTSQAMRPVQGGRQLGLRLSLKRKGICGREEAKQDRVTAIETYMCGSDVAVKSVIELKYPTQGILHACNSSQWGWVKAMNLKESEKGCVGGVRGRKRKGEKI